ncbi:MULTISPECIES: hypothetical protein [Mycobacteroides]|uniref:TetR family transcriptional regulator n=1 Tax=Mycobacteroides chelonae TaxID=1774 RepID=A0AB73N2H1_MYCCH|nr:MULTISPECIES: hypothetical protein [Mycobacteroides]OHT54954.1 hypothetical protein BKG62_01820 [Mycobacteroides chelonae]OHU67081.1 hypothetical protein BKG87_20295 [Mycobacteroides chelonae]SLG22573.1 Uncharacterised protein [Mycobacteroides abscessus subsp. abscessus]
MAAPTGADLLAFLDTATKADQTVALVTQLAKGYTRGRGFNPEPEPDVRAVIITASARLYENPQGVVSQAMGPLAIEHGQFIGWTVAELIVLNRYRERAQ